MTEWNVTLWSYRCALVRVVDGDTVILRIDEGFRNATEQSIRLVDVHAPELFSGNDRETGATAKADVQAWFNAVLAGTNEPWPFLVTTQKDKQTLGRYIGEIWAQDGRSLNDYLRTLDWNQETS